MVPCAQNEWKRTAAIFLSTAATNADFNKANGRTLAKLGMRAARSTAKLVDCADEAETNHEVGPP